MKCLFVFRKSFHIFHQQICLKLSLFSQTSYQYQHISIKTNTFVIFIFMFKRLQQQNFPIHSKTFCCKGICVNSGLIVVARFMTELSLERT